MISYLRTTAVIVTAYTWLLFTSFALAYADVNIFYRSVFPSFGKLELASIFDFLVMYLSSGFLVFFMYKKEGTKNAFMLGIFCIVIDIIFTIILPRAPFLARLNYNFEQMASKEPFWLSTLTTIMIIPLIVSGARIAEKLYNKAKK